MHKKLETKKRVYKSIMLIYYYTVILHEFYDRSLQKYEKID